MAAPTVAPDDLLYLVSFGLFALVFVLAFLISEAPARRPEPPPPAPPSAINKYSHVGGYQR